MTNANRATARSQPTPNDATRAAWLFPGKTELAITVNWRLAAIEVMVDDLKAAREREAVQDSTQIARLRLLSARCSTALARCKDASRAGALRQTD